ncbi:MAG: hypothetical protein IAF94_18385 [Pirellulaceae bacterium]|nr:hypothetical protein [Pirellulaceae bacterium]
MKPPCFHPAAALALGLAVAALGWAGPALAADGIQAARRQKEEISPNINQVAGSAWETSPPKLSLGDNASLRLMAQIRVRYDDNIFASGVNQVSDTIVSVTPGLEFLFGHNSRIRGSLFYQEAFTRYLDGAAPNANLGTGRAAIGFESGRLALAGRIALQQLYQNNQDVAGLGQTTVTRTDVLNIHTSAESPLTAKTSLAVGADINRNQYKTAGLIGSRDLTLPLKVFFEMTPKVAVSTGFSYGKVTPQGGGPESRDLDYNIGARGNFTSKLSGTLSVGYRTRRVGTEPAENMWGFDGAFDYEMTPQVSSSFVLSRNFGIGSQGQSLKSNSYSFELTAAPTPQWRFGTGLAYRHVAYGARVFLPPPVVGSSPPPTPTDRSDDYWEGNVQATYFPGGSFSTSLGYTLSSNRSTLPGARYSGNVLNLLLGWQY